MIFLWRVKIQKEPEHVKEISLSAFGISKQKYKKKFQLTLKKMSVFHFSNFMMTSPSNHRSTNIFKTIPTSPGLHAPEKPGFN